MSLIFNALKKLKSDSQPSAEETGNGLHERSNVYSFVRIFSSPLVILFLCIVGLAVYYGSVMLLSYFQQGTSFSQTQSEAYQPSRSVPAPQSNNKKPDMTENLEIPDRPEFLPTAELRPPAQQPNSILPLQGMKAAYPADEEGLQYIGRDTIPETGQQAMESPDNTDRSSQRTAAAFPAGAGKSGNDKLQQSLTEPENPKEKQYRIKIEKSKTMTLLISDIEESINARDFQKAARLFKKLRKKAKAGSPYLLKLESYLCFKTGQLDKAETILNQVLATNRNDLEANINMAAVEIQTGRKTKACQRLVKLSKIYPENDAVRKLIRKLN